MQVLAHNLMAQFTNRQLNITTNEKSKSSEKLSSGYRINRSADDAAGLSISEEMRRQIRGLNKGGTNIQEGISLCQIADGALGEVTSILQRMRQLSIQAYNGTNSKSDRACIQDEIDNCLDGINEIQERTKYNELYVLKNNGKAQDTKQVWVDESYTETVVDVRIETKSKPTWLELNDNADNKITHDYTNYTPDMSSVMHETYYYDDKDGKRQFINLYYGAKAADHERSYEWIGTCIPQLKANDPDGYKRLMDNSPQLKQYVDKHFSPDGKYDGWTPDPKDNISCKLDFGGLVTNTTTAEDLYNNMFELLGTEMGFPCGTCSRNNTIRFSGAVDGYEAAGFSNVGIYLNCEDLSLSGNNFIYKGSYIDENGNLTKGDGKGIPTKGYFQAINCLSMIKDETTRNAEAKELAQAIAEDLTARVKTTFEKNMQNHYDRVASDLNDKTTLYIYDYRDIDALKDPSKPEDKTIQTTSRVRSKYTYEQTVTVGHYVEQPNGNPSIQIQGSATVGDSIPLELRSISTKSLGLDGYSINSYKSQKIYDDDYFNRLAEYNKAMANMEYVPVTSTRLAWVQTKPPVYDVRIVYENGEKYPQETLISPAEGEMQEVTITTLEPKYELYEPQPHCVEVYNPSDLSILDKAMDQVSKMRSYFGASQNRLEHAYAANKNTEENTTAAESRIRDTDMATEMVDFSKNNILAQVGQSMLAQANQSTQGILSLLQ